MEQLIQLVNSGTIVLIALGTFAIVWGIKQTPLNNKYLPVAAILIGALIGAVFSLFAGDVQPTVGLVDGVVAGAVSVGGNEFIKSLLHALDGGAK
ncbi:holin [Lactiplantibacillus plajomi]|uniref:Holin n=1 Tax=Lactiplantibacillus plajomi TaxID=1457217 RepID=A0ABV6K0W6_9LACO|nr:holin [Lactiplantibacillus plajomi]